MRKIKISEKNIYMVAGLLRKFLENPKYGIRMYHNFDCGFKNIKPYARVTIDFAPTNIMIRGGECYSPDKYIHITFQERVAYSVINIGSIVLLSGNKIVIQQKESLISYTYRYTVYEHVTLTEWDVRDICERRRVDAEEYRTLASMSIHKTRSASGKSFHVRAVAQPVDTTSYSVLRLDTGSNKMRMFE